MSPGGEHFDVAILVLQRGQLFQHLREHSCRFLCRGPQKRQLDDAAQGKTTGRVALQGPADVERAGDHVFIMSRRGSQGAAGMDRDFDAPFGFLFEFFLERLQQQAVLHVSCRKRMRNDQVDSMGRLPSRQRKKQSREGKKSESAGAEKPSHTSLLKVLVDYPHLVLVKT